MLNRRLFLGKAFLAPAGLGLGRLLGAPAIVTRDAARPQMVSGAAVGDPTSGRAIVWSRTDRPARLLVEVSTTESFASVSRHQGSSALPGTGFTARVDLPGVPPGQRIFYRARFRDLEGGKVLSEPLVGSFRSAPAESGGGRPSVTFGWGADTAGQGWGIDPARGGMRMYDTLRKAGLDFFVHCGDTIYADNPIPAEKTLDDGTVWRNLVTEAKSKVAETLDEFRGNFAYTFLDESFRSFLLEVPQISLWDDHEVFNNWDPTKVLLQDDRYKVKSAALLSSRAKQAFLEFQPVRPVRGDASRIYRSCRYGPSLEVFALDERTYRGPNSGNTQTAGSHAADFLGARQLAWLESALAASTATWKVIASDMPLSEVIRDDQAFEAFANGDPGGPLGRERELARLLGFLKRRGIHNVVFLAGDVHYAAARHYHPDRAVYKDFDPFWEFIAGPLHAGTFLPSVLDPTFGPESRFVGVPSDMKQNRPPSEGLQFFGKVHLDGASEVLTVTLHDLSGQTLHRVELPPWSGGPEDRKERNG